MKLIIQLSNPEEEVNSMREALRFTDISVAIEDEKIVLETESVVKWELNLADNDLICKTWERVHEFLAIINGAACIESAALPRVYLAQLVYVDETGQRQHLPNIGRMYGVLPGLRSRPPDPSLFISLGLEDLAAAKAMRLFSLEHDWVNLYRIFEVIEEDVKQPVKAKRGWVVKRGWATPDEYDAFTGSANNASVTGDHSRHGKINGGTPHKTMHLADARHMIQRILRYWLNSKVAAGVGDQQAN